MPTNYVLTQNIAERWLDLSVSAFAFEPSRMTDCYVLASVLFPYVLGWRTQRLEMEYPLGHALLQFRYLVIRLDFHFLGETLWEGGRQIALSLPLLSFELAGIVPYS